MIFNENWTKEDNDYMRKMIREGKSQDDIIKHFGEEKVLFHPKKKFHKTHKAIYTKMFDFVNEIKINPEKTEFTHKRKNSIAYTNKEDIFISFKVNEHEYIIALFYMFENDIISYELLFTTKQQFEQYEKRMKEFLLIPGNHFTNEEQNELKNILKKETNFNELFTLFKSLTYIINELYNDIKFFYGDITFSITETDNPKKIRLYKNLIHDSFPDFKYKRRKIKIQDEYKYIYYYSKY